jgi:hypothetical protein
MIKRFWCWLWGYGCDWRQTYHTAHVRPGNGIFVNMDPPQVKVTVIHEQCGNCGHTRIREQAEYL